MYISTFPICKRVSTNLSEPTCHPNFWGNIKVSRRNSYNHPQDIKTHWCFKLSSATNIHRETQVQQNFLPLQMKVEAAKYAPG